MDAGRELNVLVAEKIVGLVDAKIGEITNTDEVRYVLDKGDVLRGEAFYLRHRDELPRYDRMWHKWCPSEDLVAAFQVVEHMRAKWARGDETCNFWTFKDLGTGHSGETGWRAEIEFYPDHDGPAVEAEAVAPTLPLAICLAALMFEGVILPA